MVSDPMSHFHIAFWGCLGEKQCKGANCDVAKLCEVAMTSISLANDCFEHPHPQPNRKAATSNGLKERTDTAFQI